MLVIISLPASHGSQYLAEMPPLYFLLYLDGKTTFYSHLALILDPTYIIVPACCIPYIKATSCLCL